MYEHRALIYVARTYFHGNYNSIVGRVRRLMTISLLLLEKIPDKMMCGEVQ